MSCRTTTAFRAFLAGPALSVALVAAAAGAGDLRISVSGVAPGGGAVRVAAFASAADFEGDRLFRGVVVPATGARVLATLQGLPPGDYAIAAFQDRNGDEVLSRSFLGIPNEPFGLSNGARGRFGPPPFDAMRVRVGEASRSLEIVLE